jgi:hypothetical protein
VPSRYLSRPADRGLARFLARVIHEGVVNNPGLPDEQPFSPAAGGYVVAAGSGTHPDGRVPDPPGWVRCHQAPATSDPFGTADHKGCCLARSIRERCSRILRASEPARSRSVIESE